jgi:segregation and condensation protein A
MALPQLDRDVFRRGAPESIVLESPRIFEATLYDLLSAYGQFIARREKPSYTIEPFMLHSVEQAIEHLSRLIGRLPDWTLLAQFLPAYDAARVGAGEQRRLVGRSAVAATFGASLELAKRGVVRLRQDGNFEPIYIRSARQAADDGRDEGIDAG